MLTKKQKRFIAVSIHTQTTREIASNLRVSQETVETYIRTHLGMTKHTQTVKDDRIHLSWKLLLFILLVTFVTYSRALTGSFVLDDITILEKNDSLKSFRFVLDTPSALTKNIITFATHALFGLNPLPYHAVTILFHAGTAMLVYTLAQLFFTPASALVLGLITAVHPVFSEPVTWISGGIYTMYGFFFLLSFLIYIRSKDNNIYYYISLIIYSLMLTTSVSALPMFLMFILYEWQKKTLIKNWKHVLPYIIFSVLWLIIIIFVSRDFQTRSQLSIISDTSGVHLRNPLVLIPIALSTYAGLVVWPQNLMFYHSHLSFSIPHYALSVIFFILVCALFVWSRKNNRTVFFGLSLVGVSLLPTLSPVILSWTVAERYGYLAYIGYLIAITALIEKPVLRIPKKLRIVLFSMILIALAVRTFIRTLDWQNQHTLALVSAKQTPIDPRVHNNLGNYYKDSGNIPEAEKSYREALRLDPDYAGALYNLGTIATQSAEALEYVKKAIELDPTMIEPYQYMASYYFDQKNYTAASDILEKAVTRTQPTSLLYANLALSYLRSDNISKATENIQKALALDSESVYIRSIEDEIQKAR